MYIHVVILFEIKIRKKNVHPLDINVFAKFYEIPSLPFQDIEKQKHRRRTNGWTDGQCENSIPPQTRTV